MKKIIGVLMALFVFVVFAFAGGKGDEVAASKGINIKPLIDDGSGVILPIGNAKGPNGENPASVQDLLNLIPPDKTNAIKNGNYTAAVSLHTTSSDWAILTEKGIRDALGEYNIKLLAVTDAQMKVEKQVSDLESIIAMKPNIIISFILDADAIAPVLRNASSQGIIVSLIDSVPTGFKSPADYAGMGTSDNYGNGKAAAQKLVDYLGAKGEVAILKYVSSLFHTDARVVGARDVFAQYPNIKIVAEQGCDGADTAATATESILTAHPNIKGIWAVWDAPGMGAVGVIENMGKDVKVVTVDLSEDSGYSIASDGALLATGAQHPYDQGVAQAMIGIAALAGVAPPPYVLVPGEIVTKDTIPQSWERVFQSPLPRSIADFYK
jgi:ribose transport system substrate-binding protein